MKDLFCETNQSEVLKAIHLAGQSPKLSDRERECLRRTLTLLELSWNDGWRVLCLRTPGTRRVFDTLPPPSPEVWQDAMDDKDKHGQLLLRGETHLRYSNI